MFRSQLAIIAASACLVLATQATGQTAISTEGLIESKSGGFKFPDGSVQTTATESDINARVAELEAARTLSISIDVYGSDVRLGTLFSAPGVTGGPGYDEFAVLTDEGYLLHISYEGRFSYSPITGKARPARHIHVFYTTENCDGQAYAIVGEGSGLASGGLIVQSGVSKIWKVDWTPQLAPGGDIFDWEGHWQSDDDSCTLSEEPPEENIYVPVETLNPADLGLERIDLPGLGWHDLRFVPVN